MKKAGFYTVNLSFVSTDPFTKERMKRPKAMIGFHRILEEAERVGLQVVAYAIIGMPSQTIDEMVETMIYLMGKKVLIGPSVYYPTPGTPLYERCEGDGILPSHPSQWRSSALPIETKEFNRLDIVTLFRLARVINFIKGKMDEGELNEGTTWKELSQIVMKRAGTMPYALSDKDDVRWAELLFIFFRERSFFSLRKDPEGKMSILKEASSKKVLDSFFEKARERPILKSRHD
jgi:radical SAM superfamily enzyme YgiQ (UPF0313 family)